MSYFFCLFYLPKIKIFKIYKLRSIATRHLSSQEVIKCSIVKMQLCLFLNCLICPAIFPFYIHIKRFIKEKLSKMYQAAYWAFTKYNALMVGSSSFQCYAPLAWCPQCQDCQDCQDLSGFLEVLQNVSKNVRIFRFYTKMSGFVRIFNFLYQFSWNIHF